MAINKNRVPVREQDPQIRATNFEEVCLGYNEDEAVNEANRCLTCKLPQCVNGCPVGINIPGFISYIKNKDYYMSAKEIAKFSALPAICGRVCPQERQCEAKCIMGKMGDPISIGKLERFIADYSNEHDFNLSNVEPPNGHKVAIIGSGPSGLTCAGDLARRGYDVTIFEALHKAGGVLVYGIPEFRLPKDKVVAKEVENVKKLGVKIINDCVIGKTISIDELFNEGYEAIFIGSGAGLPKFMNIKGENANGVFSANEFLTRVNLMKGYSFEYQTPLHIGKKVAVVGGGNVAMDAVRTILRLGSDATIVYRRSEAELPARLEEVMHAKEEGVKFEMLTNPIEIFSNEAGNVTGMKCVRMMLGEPDVSGRRRPVVMPDSEFIMDVDTVIMALGTSPNPLISKSTNGLNVDNHGCIVVNEEGLTSKKMVYAGGDAVSGASTVILAMEAGKIAAKAIDEKLKNK